LNPTAFTTHLTLLPPEKGGLPSGKTERKGILILRRKERNQLTPEHTELIENFILKPIEVTSRIFGYAAPESVQWQMLHQLGEHPVSRTPKNFSRFASRICRLSDSLVWPICNTCSLTTA